MQFLGSRAASAFLLLFPFLLAGCERRDEQIKVYRLIKPTGESTPMEKDAIASTNAPVKSTIERVPSATSNVATPPNWEPQPLSQMRQASFLVHGENGAVADISFVRLGPAAGNVLDNVNRWLGQLAQPPITADKLAEHDSKTADCARAKLTLSILPANRRMATPPKMAASSRRSVPTKAKLRFSRCAEIPSWSARKKKTS